MAIRKRTSAQILNKDIDAIDTILKCISKAQKYTDFSSVGDFETNEMAFDASIRQVEVIGEAIKRLSEKTQKDHPEINWSALAKMRDRLIHQYDRIDALILWDTIKKELPLEIPKLQRIKKELSSQKQSFSTKQNSLTPKLF